MAPSNILFSSIIILAVMLAREVHSQTSFDIDSFSTNSSLLTYEREANVPPNETFLRLVPISGVPPYPPVASVGRVLYNNPVKLWEQGKQASFETTITFNITPYDDSSLYGMTFFIIPVNSITPEGGENDNLGIYDAVLPGAPVFAVEFDFAGDLEYDPGYAHIGININSLQSQNHTQIPWVIRDLVTARLTYDAPTRMIGVVATYGSTVATVSFVFNLKALLPREVQVGLSAASDTARRATHYDVHTWHFSSTMVDDVNTVVDEETFKLQYDI